jgi:uncharacterized protein
MHLDLNTLVGGRAHVERTYGPSAFPSTDGYRVAGNVELVLDLRQRDDQYDVTGRMRAPLELVCSRCLDGFPRTVEADLDLVYVPDAAAAETSDHEVGPEDFSVSYYRDKTIDLGELLREQFELALPMKPLCADGCLGLCPVCGGNRNRESCSCRTAWEDPRLAVLKRFVTKPSGPSTG